MRRTLFVFPRDLLPAAWGSASARVAAQLRTRLAKDVAGGGARRRRGGLARRRRGRRARPASPTAPRCPPRRSASEVPELAGPDRAGRGQGYGGNFPIAPRVLTQLGVEALIVRGRNGGHWRISRPPWTPMEAWLGEAPAPLPGREGYAELVRRWLATFGPAPPPTSSGGWARTDGAVKHALADVGAVEVGPRRRRHRLGAARRRRRPTPTSSPGRRCCRCSTRR